MEINGMEVELDLRYSEMNLSQGILQALNQKGFTMATPVQAGAIPCFKDWKDVIAKAPTGSGKTFAFGIPMVEHTDPEGTEVTGLILAPTRELALQIQDEIRQLCAFLPGIRVACLYGGQPIDRQINQLKKRPQIVVATPGRLMDHMKRRTIRLHKVETVVLDEADRMLDMGFIKDVTRILKQIPHRRNLGMFSATISREVMDISWVYQRDPVEIVVRPVQENRPQIQQYRIKVDQGGKVDLLIGDFVEGYGILDQEITASNLARMDPTASDEDWAAGISTLVLQVIGTMSLLACEGSGAPEVVVIGAMAASAPSRRNFAQFERVYGKRFIIPEHSACATAIGAARRARCV